jgi:hypothetical protein
MKRKSVAVSEDLPVRQNDTPMKQLRSMNSAILLIKESNLWGAIKKVVERRSDFVRREGEHRNSRVKENLDQYVELFRDLACGGPIVIKAIQTLAINGECSKVLPSFSSLINCLTWIYTLNAKKDSFISKLDEMTGLYMEDFWDEDMLVNIEKVINACVRLKQVCVSADEMSMLLD